MEQTDLDKLIRITSQFNAMSAMVVKAEPARWGSYASQYDQYYNLVQPLIGRYSDYQLEFSAVPKPGFAHVKTVIAYVSLQAFLDTVIKQETLGSREIVDKLTNEFFIDDNKPFSAHKVISDITTKAVTTLKIVDNYLESSSLDFFFPVNTKVNIYILTMMLKPNTADFKVSLGKFLSQWQGANFEIKTTNYFHDRYIIVDDKDVWHLGPSLNRLGIKPAMISKINDDEISKKIIQLFDSQWTTSIVI